MLRLTVRSARDGRFLCRVVARGGFPFVLDFGDERLIDDASQKLLHGFTMWREGRLVTVTPQHPGILDLLAEFYAHEGLLVFLEEPTWPGRARSLEDRLPGPPLAVGDLPDLAVPTDEDPVEEASTELIDLEDLPSVDDYMELDDDAPTEVVTDES